MGECRSHTLGAYNWKFRQCLTALMKSLKGEGQKYLACMIFWVVTNHVPVLKKQGTIRVCTNFNNLKKACPKDKFPTHFIE